MVNDEKLNIRASSLDSGDSASTPNDTATNASEPITDLNRLATSDVSDVSEAFLCFRLGPFWLAVAVMQVEEVCELGMVSPLPRVPPYLPGIMSWRGRALPLLDLNSFFDIKERASVNSISSELHSASHPVLQSVRVAVVSAENMRVGILSHQVRGVLEQMHFQRKKPEIIQQTKLAEFIWAEMLLDGELLLALDLNKLLQAAKVQR